MLHALLRRRYRPSTNAQPTVGRSTGMTGMRPAPILAAAAGSILALGAAAPDADATWSIVMCDIRTGEVVAASATCLTDFDLRAETPVVIAGLGAATAQSSVDADARNRTRIRDGLVQGLSLEEILADLSTFDAIHQNRQYGMATVDGQTLTFSGDNANEWKGGVTGRFGDVVYAIQGNILTGAPVVLEAEQRIIDHLRDTRIDNTYDLPGATLAGMEGARALGGDGRCSCTSGGATSCGSPPPEPFKSADIGYVIVARIGDLDRCTAVYPSPTLIDAAVAGDVTGDGIPDIISSAQSGGVFITQPAIPGPDDLRDVLRLEAPGPIVPTGTRMRNLAIADVDGDGNNDILGPSNDTGGLVVLQSLGDGDFLPAASYGAGTSANNRGRTIAIADFDAANGPDAAVVDGRGENIRIFLNNGDGTFTEAANAFNGRRFRGIGAGDLNDDGTIDLVAASDITDTVVILSGNGDGTFTTLVDDDVAGEPEYVVVADLDADGIADAVVGGAGATGLTRYSADTREPNGIGREALTTDGTVLALSAGDLNNDGNADLVVASPSGAYSVFRSTASGIETSATSAGSGASTGSLVFADFGLGVQGIGVRSGSFAVFQNTNALGFDPSNGCGEGEYYLSLNVAFAERGDADPVFQLQDQFDDARDALVGVPDAVRTLVTTPLPSIPGGTDVVFTVTPRDWNADDLGPGAVLGLIARASENTTVEPDSVTVTNNGNGTFDVRATLAPDVAGTLDLDIVALTSAGTVLPLMQPAAVEVRVMDADFNNDGSVNILDILAFLTAWNANDAIADLDNSGTFNILDVLAFIALFQGV